MLNLIFPVWILYIVHPLGIIIALFGNAVIDTAIIYFYIRKHDLQIYDFRWYIGKTILLGFLADLVGAIILISLYSMNGVFDYIFLWDNALNVIVHIIVVLVVGILIYVFNRWNYKDSVLTLKQQKHLSIGLAIITMPYTFLIPASILF